MSDVVILGAGPAGLTLGCYLAKAGISSVILEKAHHPRPHVGESLMPSTVRVFREIDFLPIMEAAEFPRSGGIVYHPRGRKSTPIAYAEFPQDGVDQAYTYHVDRSKFDMLLLKHAESLGCQIVQGATAREVLFDEAACVTGVRVAVAGQEIVVPARIVVDAAGRGTRLGRQLELRRDHPVFDQFGLHAWFFDVDRGKRNTADYTHIFFIPELRGWAWQAPINSEITSLGLVADKGIYQESGLSVEDFFTKALGHNAALAKATRGAKRLNDLKGEVNYSYQLEQVCGNGWIAIGDAARFIDPIFSSGVGAAMHMARFAAERIQAALESGDVSRATFLPYEDKVLTDAAIWDDFIRLFYRLLPSFTHVVESPRHRLAVLQLIQGEVHSDSYAPILDEMRSLVTSVERADDHELRGELMEFPRR
ncbi:MAG: NAD(P)/FAD-dependent oxidoreductase [Gemmatimonadota bacterium]|nr:NAD(P)/FAD-dependent oxidoreductase [Gemmatimonadota bacterium]MDH3422773.1 NAD(P)/FAD-dependent oxidoreductase [Gemmatimonadota bacterium]